MLSNSYNSVHAHATVPICIGERHMIVVEDVVLPL